MSEPTALFGRRKYPVDIIVRAWGKPELTGACVSSILLHTDPKLYRLTVVENRHPQDHPWVAQEIDAQVGDEWVQRVTLPDNMGAVRATNAGLLLAYLTDSKYVLIFDNDARVPDGDKEWLPRWLKYMGDEKVAAVGAVSDRVSGVQQALAMPNTFAKPWHDVLNGEGGQDGPITVPWLISFACLYRKDLLAQLKDPVALWDERYEPGNSEDLDVAFRLRHMGFELRAAPDVFIHHDMHATFQANFNLGELLRVNEAKMVSKFGMEALEGWGYRVAPPGGAVEG
ncbi:MAG TPA: glycosyltransferase [Phycisphaerae bacterium]|nr:glycosyltransferase [Phycisphaerae bacterium]